MPSKVHLMSLGQLMTNCFIVADTDTQDAVVIDPAGEAPDILEVIEEEGYVLREILATHAHFDHVLAAKPLKDATGAPFRLHAADLDILKAMQPLAALFGIVAPQPATPDGTLEEGDIIHVGGIRLEVLHTPGHSPGHVTFAMREEKIVLSGDCVFMDGIGRTDLPGGDFQTLMTSIFEKIVPLGDDFTICPGHGPTTTIGRELRSNPYFSQWRKR